ncbi:S-adenosyl-L-methionine methyltransferase [Salinihabitans flavidus]|uniref:S-adenosyl-L-methionine methyltransferase n=1 Tax=Salinihabitans flavidus TaxID=569882 RepID=A0A1H8QWP3_9RHOB|nr:class I SAM-dependent methyltransferase [Salinihabitans flavidus]SEO58605.1 S-adenosyl-L-methionine methyltransferase [Salinihabitans flavidus]
MSRLDIFINRMVSQRACIDFAVRETAATGGPVFELGLGNGRTYDHLRERLSQEEVFVFDREVASNPASTPPRAQILMGDVMETLPQALRRFGATARIVHADLGGHNLEKNDAFARKVSPLIEPLLAPGGIMVSSDRMYFEALEPMPLPEGAVEGRCFLYRRG